MKAVEQRAEDPSDFNLFHVKEVADQETALHKSRGCSTLSAIHTETYGQTILYKITEH